MLREMAAAGRAPQACRHAAADYREEQPQLTAKERQLLDALDGADRSAPPALADGLGLYDPADRTPAARPTVQLSQKILVSPAAEACLRALDEMIHQHRSEPVTVERPGGEREALLGDLAYGFPLPQHDQPRAENLARLPLAKDWQKWLASRPSRLRDQDGLELLRALAAVRSGKNMYAAPHTEKWRRSLAQRLFGSLDLRELRYPGVIMATLMWLLWMQPPPGGPALLIDAVETTFTLIPLSQLKESAAKPGHHVWHYTWRIDHVLLGWLNLARLHRTLFPEQWQPTDHIRFYRLLRWMEQPVEGVARIRPAIEDALLAYAAGGATAADLYDQLIGPRTSEAYYWGWGNYQDLMQLSGTRQHPLAQTYPVLDEIVAACRARIVEIELGRGDMPTEVSSAARALRWSGGAQTLVSLLRALGRVGLIRGWTSDSLSRQAIFSHLIRVTYPADDDTPQRFAQMAQAAGIGEGRLIEVALYAPQWAEHVAEALGWEGFVDAVWWLVAHTKDTAWHVDRDIRETWAAQVSLRTPLNDKNLLDGAVDVSWFWQVYETLGAERWERLYKAAKYTSSSGGHKRAQLFADALLNRVTVDELTKRVAGKRHRDALLALGLVPLHPGDGREDDLLARYEIIQEFLRTSRKFGAQRREHDRRAAAIALENLARRAGYADPIRLQWAMEKQAVAPLARGSLTVEAEGYRVTLRVDELGAPHLDTVNAQGRRLKSVPTRIKKVAEIADLREMQSTIRQQASRMRRALEEAMVRGDTFTFGEIAGLLEHPVLRPMIESVLFTGKGAIGYPVQGERGLIGFDGAIQRVQPDTALRIAHPVDLLSTGQWAEWQRDCFVAERVQPFKQVFRELYVLTATEQEEGVRSLRYAGHQVNPKQALALLASRGWVNHYEEGARRTFHEEGITAWVASLAGGFTPAEVSGLTVEEVAFYLRGDWRPMKLEDVPPRLFSEVMRDLDLVVSVAHAGGVDPEASASTVEMRSALLREMCAALRLDNVSTTKAHAVVEGALATYSVHLGSGVVHKQPGGALCIIPVHAQHRGRLFLPFADDDPKTGEVLSKVLLLARDASIKDASILEQILSS